MNLFSILEGAAERWPENTLMVHGDRSFRYRDLYLAAESLAASMRRAGIRAGSKVGLMYVNSPEHVAAFFAVLRVGGIVVPISPALKAVEVVKLADEMMLDAFCYSVQFESSIPDAARDRKSTRLNSSHIQKSRMPSSA